MRLTGLPEAAAKPSFAACAGLLTYAGRNHADAVLQEAASGPLTWFGKLVAEEFLMQVKSKKCRCVGDEVHLQDDALVPSWKRAATVDLGDGCHVF